MPRQIQQINCTIDPTWPISFTDKSNEQDVKEWLMQHAMDATWLLAHTEQGMIWGKMADGKLTTSRDAFPQLGVSLTPFSLQSCRLFGKNSELLLWREDTAWHVRRITEGKNEAQVTEYIDEAQILWGTQQEGQNKGFTLVADGVQGLRHAVPLETVQLDPIGKREKQRPLRLQVRHYLARNLDDGMFYIAGSRLVELFCQLEEEK
ncbi:CRISPR-associated protein Csx19 [soil metagenome]